MDRGDFSTADVDEIKGGRPRSRWKTRFFIDTEFTDFLDSQLISVAIVGEDGREFYGGR